jgi:hypothetical protein
MKQLTDKGIISPSDNYSKLRKETIEVFSSSLRHHSSGIN